MNTRSTLLYVGIVLVAGAGSKLSTLMGLTGFSAALFALFALGILLVAREPARQLTERVRVLEAKLEQRNLSQAGSGPSPAA